MPARLVRFTVALLLLAACDVPTDLGIEQNKATPAKHPAAPEHERPAAPEVAAAANGPAGDTASHGRFTDCLLRCDAARMSHAEKAKCRYDCEEPAPPASGAVPQPTAANDPDPVGSAVACFKRCPPSGKYAVECTDACKNIAAAAPMAPSTAVLDELAACVSTCQHDPHLSATNRETCELTCAETARVAGPARSGYAVANPQ